MNVSSWSIRNPIPAVMLFVLLSFAGLIAFNSMKVQLWPDMELPNIIVTASLPGTAPEQLENDVARQLENAVASLQSLKHTYTHIQEGSVTVTAEFLLEKPLQEALDDVRSAVQKVRADLPAGVRDPVVQQMNTASSPMLVYAIRSSKMDDEALSWLVDHTLSRQLLSIRGVGAVTRVGGVSRQVQVVLDPLKLQSLGLSTLEVSRQVQQVQQDAAGGRADVGSSEQSIRTLGAQRTAQDIAALSIPLSRGRTVRLDQVASVNDTVAEVRASAYLDGKPVVGFEVVRTRGASEVAVGADVRQMVQKIREQHPDLEITEAFDFVTPVEEDYNASLTMLYEGALLAVVVVWCFLRDWRATFIAAVALPLSVIPAFLGMAAMGFSINAVSLLALSLVIGVLVDDAIVEIENIVRHLRMGKTPYQAAMEAADEIGLAVVATTLTLIAVFLPTAFMGGIPGRFFKEFGWTASFAVFASLVVARMLTPMMAAYLLKPLGHASTEPAWLQHYMRMVSWCTTHKGLTVLCASLFFIGSLGLIALLPTSFQPPDDHSQTQVTLELPPGSTLQQTQVISEQARQLLMKLPAVRSIYTTIGSGNAGANSFVGGDVSNPTQASLTIQLQTRGERESKQQIEQQIRQQLTALPGVRSKVSLGRSTDRYLVALSSDNPASLQATVTAIQQELRSLPGLGSITSSAGLTRPEIVIRPDLAKAAALGVSTASIGETLRVATQGDYDMQLAKLNLPQRQVDILVKLDDAARRDISQLQRLMVPGNQGPVMLGQVADIQLASGPASINRYDRSRNININIELSGQPMGEVKRAVAQLPSVRQLPADVQLVGMGEAELMNELFTSFSMAMFTGILCIYVVLVLLFKHFMHPITILAALPLSLGGAFVGLLATQQSLSMPSMIGLIMLMGITTKNAILLVEYAIVVRRGNDGSNGEPIVAPKSRMEALLDACYKRARPIIMTSIAMGAGMLPSILGWSSADSSFRFPMGVAVIGGLITSTVLSLVVIPTVYLYLDDFTQWLYQTVLKLQAMRFSKREKRVLIPVGK